MEKIKNVAVRIGAFLLGVILLPVSILTIVATFLLVLICIVKGCGAKGVKIWWYENILPLVALEVHCFTFALVPIDV